MDRQNDGLLGLLMRMIGKRPVTKLGALAIIITTVISFIIFRAFPTLFTTNEIITRAFAADTHQPTIVAILPLTGPDSWSGRQIQAAIEYAHEDRCIADPEFCANVSLRILDDRGDVEVARRHARDAAEDSDVIAVIGHFSSSVTSDVLSIYCDEDVDLPLIMPVPTATHITYSARNIGCSASVRLPPSNQLQGQQLAELVRHIEEHHDHNEHDGTTRYIALFRDQNNAEYSNSLGREFASALSADSSINYKLAIDIAVSGPNGGLIVTDTIAQYDGMNIWVIAGMTPAVLQTLRQASALGILPDHVILTDGAISEQLFIEGRDVIGSNIHLLFQTPPDSQRLQQVLSVTEGDGSELSFAPYGNDAYMLLALLIEGQSQDGLGFTREQMRREVANLIPVNSDSSIDYPRRPNERLTLRQLSFDRVGNNQNIRYSYYVYEESDPVGGGRFVRELIDD